MFDSMLESTNAKSEDRSKWSFPIALGAHVLAIALILGASYLIVQPCKTRRHDLLHRGGPSASTPSASTAARGLVQAEAQDRRGQADTRRK
jgi:hypothetical protein